MAGKVVVSTLNNDTGVLATQNGMTGIAKAWVNFDSSSGSSCVIGTSFNVSSVTYNATGDYTVNFTTAMPNSNYAFFGQTRRGSSGFGESSVTPGSTDTKTTTALQIRSGFDTTASNFPEINVSVFSS